MVRGVDGASTVHVLLADCLALLRADSAGVLVRVGEQEIELLAATSHQANQLELYQSQLDSGPCVETIETGHVVHAAGASELTDRWPEFGRAMSAAGLVTIHASPMRWHERVLGGLNLFWQHERTLTAEERELAQAFADICTLALMQSPDPDDAAAVAEKLRTALQGRVLIERAKGVLSQSEQLDMAEAFTRLVQISRQTTRPLADVAQSLLEDIVAPRG
jgi:GAF domain-containing protein